MTSSSAVIAVRKIGSAVVHAAPQSGTWQGARLFERTACGIEIRANGEWQEVSADGVRSAIANVTPHYVSDFVPRLCKRCSAQSPDGGVWRIVTGEEPSLPPVDSTPVPESALVSEFEIGERVGIVRGLQSVNGPRVYAFGTVVRTVETWKDLIEFVVRTDDGSELLYRSYLLRHIPDPAPVPDDAAPGLRNCTHSWHVDSSDGLPLCRGAECKGMTVACGQGLVRCLRHAWRAPEWAPSVPSLPTPADADAFAESYGTGAHAAAVWQASQSAQEAPARAELPETEGEASRDDSGALSRFCPTCGAAPYFPCEDEACSFAVPTHAQRFIVPQEEDEDAAFRTCNLCGDWLDASHGFAQCPNVMRASRPFTDDEYDTLSDSLIPAIADAARRFDVPVPEFVVREIADDAANALSRYGIRR